MSSNSDQTDSSDVAAFAALAVAIVALLVAGAQVAQQYAASGEKIRLADSSVYGPMPGQGRRKWNWVQSRFNVMYDMPQITINPDLWRFVHDTSVHNPYEDDDLINLPNLLLSQVSLEEHASTILKSSPWTWTFKIIRHWGLWAALTWRIPVKPYAEADYQYPRIALWTLLATEGDPKNLSNLLRIRQSLEKSASILLQHPQWLWPWYLVRHWGWRALLTRHLPVESSLDSAASQGAVAAQTFDLSDAQVLPAINEVSEYVSPAVVRRSNSWDKPQPMMPLRVPLIPLSIVLDTKKDPQIAYRKARQDYIDLFKHQGPSEASWVHFCRTIQGSCGNILKYQMVRYDVDRCPDLPVVPMLVSLRDSVILCLMSGMSFTRVDIPNRLVSMEGSAGALLSSSHPVLGSVFRFIPRSHSTQLGSFEDNHDTRLPAHQIWLRRVVGQSNLGRSKQEEEFMTRFVQQIHERIIFGQVRMSMTSEDLPEDFLQDMSPQTDGNSEMPDNNLSPNMPADEFGRVEGESTTAGASTPSNVSRPGSRPWKHASKDQRAIRRWKEAWPGKIASVRCYHHESERRNSRRRQLMKERLAKKSVDQSELWFWASQLDTIRGFWATPWVSRFDAGFCAKAQIIVIEALRVLLNPDCLHFINPSGQLQERPPGFFYPAVTSSSHGNKQVSSQWIAMKELPQWLATKDAQVVEGFTEEVPPLMLVDFLVSPAISPSGRSSHAASGHDTMRNQIEIDELMWLDSWLLEVEQSSDVKGGWLEDIRFRIHEAMELFHDDFLNQPPAEPSGAASHRYEISRTAMKYAQGSAVDMIWYLEGELLLTEAQQVYFLAALLRTLKTAYCIATGVDTTGARDIFEKDISVYFA